MSRFGKSAICAYESIIYHKVGRSIDTSSSEVLIGKIYINYLNRFVDLKEYWSKPVWLAWRSAYVCYIIPMLKIRYRLPTGKISNMVRALIRDSSKLDVVELIRSFKRSVSPRIAPGGAPSEARIDTGNPASLPGV